MTTSYPVLRFVDLDVDVDLDPLDDDLRFVICTIWTLSASFEENVTIT